MNHPPVRTFVLEMQKPPLSRRRVNERALVGPVDGRGTLREHNAALVWSANAARAENRLPTRSYAARRRKNVIPTVALVELRTLERRIPRQFAAVDHKPKVVDDFRPTGIQFVECENILDIGTAGGPGVNQVNAAIVIPKRTGIDDATTALHQRGSTPRSAWIGGGHEINSEIRIGIINPVFAGVKTDRRCPNAFAVLGRVENILRREARQRVSDQFPVYQVPGMKDRQPWHLAEAGADQPVVVPHPHDVRIRIVGMQHRIFICAVHAVGLPDSSRQRES